MRSFILFSLILGLASCDHDFSSYPFKATLNTAENGGLYELYWNFDNDAENIYFAVRVETTGWVGFGLSPNGQMPNSDMVIGWVTDDGDIVFHDRFAEDRAPPTIDASQDWYLKNGEEENGFTILEFSRKYITCDDKDLPVTAETARVIWSFRTGDDPTTEELSFDLIHTEKRSISLNLLGGLPSAAPDPNDLEYYDVVVDQITIPKNDTTYWCAAFKIPEKIQTQTKYVTKFGPLVTEGNEAHVHHLVVYLCSGINDTHVGNGGECEEGVANEVAECRIEVIIAAWAVGGEIFTYPDNVALPIGGEGFPGYIVMELHYDNPEEISGTLDSSGMRFWYTSTPRQYDAGMLSFGHIVYPYMVIPPNVKNFTTTSLLTAECTEKYIPEDGIHIFASFLHTHVVGHGLTVQHIRYNSDCDVYEELEPIDRNLNYDFNYQQINHLPHEVTIMPGDLMQLKCFYGTEGVDGVTLGGLSTRDEMCFSFLIYYPRVDFSISVSSTVDEEYFEFLQTFPSGQQILNGEVGYLEGLNAANWDEDMIQALQTTYDNSTQQVYCGANPENSIFMTTNFPEVGCSYIAPDQCSDFTPATCCERVDREVEDTGLIPRASLALLIVLSLLAAIQG